MKKCPTCERTFDENMRFCQADGTPLVDDAPAIDPYKTMVSSSRDIADSIPAAETAPPVEAPKEKEQEVLELPPDRDPKKTMLVSEDEIRREMASHDEPVVDLPPVAPEPPKFSEPSPKPRSFGEPQASPPPSPFSAQADDRAANQAPEQPFNVTTPPIPSPFESPKPSAIEAPAAMFDQRPMADPPPGASEDLSAGLGAAPVAAAPMQTAPPAVQNWESNEPMQNQQFTPPSASAAPSQTLAIVSLVLGILGFTLCCGTLLPSIAAVVTGFMAKSKATNDPAAYGGSGLALGGIITGVLGVLISIGYLIFVFFFGGLQLMTQGM
ncbi:MAG: DUF4190 domain-containing protein [Pyrinomonadaceae bacterium]